MTRRLRALSAFALLLPFASASQALTFTFNATDSGWHSSAGNHTISNQDYEVGWEDVELRNFFVFDLSALPLGETILSATLYAYNPKAGEPNASFTDGYDSPDAFEAYNLREVLATAAVVTAPSAFTPAVYTDLGDGAVFGTQVATDADNGQFIEIALNDSGKAALEIFAGVGEYVLGGHVSSLTPTTFGIPQFVFGHTDPPGFGPYTRQLCITTTGGPGDACVAPIPEPGTGALIALGLVVITSARRSRASARRIG